MAYYSYVQFPPDAQYGDPYWARDQDCCRDQDRPRRRRRRSSRPREEDPKSRRDIHRDDRFTDAGRARSSPSTSPIDDDFYRRARSRTETRRDDIGRGRNLKDHPDAHFNARFNTHFNAHSGAHFDDGIEYAWVHADRVRTTMGINDEYFPWPMPPHETRGFSGYATGYSYYSPDSHTGPHRRDPPPTRPFPHPPRAQTRPADPSYDGWARQARPKPREPFHYVYVGTTGPDGEVIDGYKGYRTGPPHR
ncbi:uncharacterized protein B0H64DRAFT_65297 [Chaetomium fimeti]|uniref:Uncharacterized protein n=1 Tax=Chaetomium fimeti TaxID=1854472 RepID=A0AAE0HKD0_9PEZI|nr:hypothetical protein B0H64DRAFT_65297 [Chaetomium fimeti]